MEKKFSKERWNKALRGLGKKYRVYVPVKEGDFHIFRILGEVKKPDFSYQNSRLSPKSIVYPQSERMFECVLEESEPGGNVYKETGKDYQLQIIAGIRPCDAPPALHAQAEVLCGQI
jgi:hypothetical protein